MNEPDEQPRDPRTLELTPRELGLLLKYGYPFPDAAQRLRDSKAVKGYHRVPIDAYWIEMMLADIVRSAKKIRSASLLDELDALCSEMESALANRRPSRAVALK